jgi:hypothetical protein
MMVKKEEVHSAERRQIREVYEAERRSETELNRAFQLSIIQLVISI